MTKVSGSQLITRCLSTLGIDTVFAVAGDHTLPLMDTMHNSGIRFIDTRHEQGAVDMANAWGRIKHKPGISMFTTPGHANAIPGLAFAHQLESPIINISGCASQDRLGQWAAQEIDQVGMAKPVTKDAWLIQDVRRIPEFFWRSYKLAMTGRRGPIHLTIPVDVQTAKVDISSVWQYEPPNHTSEDLGQSAPQKILDAIEILNSASSPVVVAGNGAWSLEQGDLDAFAEITRIPILNEQAARGVISDEHPYGFGISDIRVVDTAKLISKSDAILLLGKKLDFTFDFGEPPCISSDAKIIQIDPDPQIIGRTRRVDIGICGNVREVVLQLTEVAKSSKWKQSNLVDELAATHDKQQKDLDSMIGNENGIHAMEVHQTAKRLAPNDTCLVFEGADFGFYGAAYWPATSKDRWFTNGVMGMLGWAIPFGIGAQVALPQSKVLVFAGDGSFGFNGLEIDTAVRHNIPAIILIGNDSVWGIDYHQQKQFFGQSIATELLPNTRYDLIAKALGAHGEFVQDLSELAPALERAYASTKPSVINVKTIPSPSPLTKWVLETKQY